MQVVELRDDLGNTFEQLELAVKFTEQRLDVGEDAIDGPSVPLMSSSFSSTLVKVESTLVKVDPTVVNVVSTAERVPSTWPMS